MSDRDPTELNDEELDGISGGIGGTQQAAAASLDAAIDAAFLNLNSAGKRFETMLNTVAEQVASRQSTLTNAKFRG